MQAIDDAGVRTTPASRLATLASGGASPAEIRAFFDSLPPVTVDAMLGRWRGTGLPSGHPMDGLLERFGWYGKEFKSPEDVQPLLCRLDGGEMFAVNPAFVPIGLVNRHPTLFHTRFAERVFGLTARAAATQRPTARLRMTEHRGVLTATMIYDSLPINDVFRSVDSDTVLGDMDLRGMKQPFWFILRRDKTA